ERSLGLRSVRGAGGKYRIGDLRLLAGHAVQERGNRADFVLVQFTAQLAVTHDRNGLFELPDLTAVEVRRGQRDIAQRRGTEDVLVASGIGHREATLVAGRQHFGSGLLDHAEGEVTLATKVDAVVAGRA